MTHEELRTHIRLQRELLQLLAQLATLPYGTTANWNSSGGKSSEHPGGKRPAGESRPEGARLLDEWASSRSVAAKEDTLRRWREELRAWRHAPEPPKAEDRKVLFRDIQSKRGWTDREVAQAMRQPVAVVHEARLAVKCCPAKGYPYVGCSVVELANRGNSVRQIELMVGVSKSVVDRMLKRAA